MQWIFVSICFQKVAQRICNKLGFTDFTLLTGREYDSCFRILKWMYWRKNHSLFDTLLKKKNGFCMGRFMFLVVKQKMLKLLILCCLHMQFVTGIFSVCPSLCLSHLFSITLELDLPCQWVRLIHCRVFSVIQYVESHLTF